MNYSETPLLLDCQGEPMLGICCLPETPSSLGFVVVVGGPQYRAGSHRQFLLLSRQLAAAGHSVLRFDYRGMGDSSGEPRSFEQVDADIAAGIDALASQCTVLRQVVLFGLCDGAAASLLYCARQKDPRVAGLCLLNPWARSEATLAQTHIKHYYLDRLRQPGFWWKLARGQLGLASSIKEFLLKFKQAKGEKGEKGDGVRQAAPEFHALMAQALTQFPGAIQIILSGNDYTAKEFRQWAQSEPSLRRLGDQKNLQMLDIADADHTFSSAEWRGRVEQAVLTWMGGVPVRKI